MGYLKTLWGFLFRLFPCPTRTGLRTIGNPGPDSPVLVTCNFDLTVKRLTRILERLDVWLLVADSRGVNVWCAAVGEEFNSRSVVSAIKTSGVADMVNHRTLILPPLGAAGIKANEVRDSTGWKVMWGPVYAADIPQYIKNNFKKTDSMKRVTYRLKERLDTALGSFFPFYFLGGIGFLLFGRHLFVEYILTGAAAFILFISFCPWIPGKTGHIKALWIDIILGIILIGTVLFSEIEGYPIRTYLIMALVIFPLYGLDLGGMSSTMPANLEPILARFGISSIGNIAIAGTIRMDLLNGYRRLSYDRDVCIGCRSCEEVCPRGVWGMDEGKRAVLKREERCTACGGCLVQCESGAIQTEKVA